MTRQVLKLDMYSLCYINTPHITIYGGTAFKVCVWESDWEGRRFLGQRMCGPLFEIFYIIVEWFGSSF